MPHVEVKYSDNIEMDVDKIFDTIENTINSHDNSAGVCKSRAYPCSQYKHTHLLVTISLLSKKHRDKTFTEKLSNDIEKVIKAHLKQNLYFSLNIEYSLAYYTTNMHIVDSEAL